MRRRIGRKDVAETKLQLRTIVPNLKNLSRKKAAERIGKMKECRQAVQDTEILQ
jgi:hypothetical protein